MPTFFKVLSHRFSLLLGASYTAHFTHRHNLHNTTPKMTPTSSLDVLPAELRCEIWPAGLAPPVDGSIPHLIVVFRGHDFHSEIVELYGRVSGRVDETNGSAYPCAKLERSSTCSSRRKQSLSQLRKFETTNWIT